MISQYFPTKTYYACVDLEATCCNDDSFPRGEMEIIEFGCTVLDPDFNYVAEFNTFVRPTIHTQLTDFCKNLTTITQQDVDNAKTWADVVPEIDAFLDSIVTEPNTGILWMSWGEFDANQIKKDCQRQNVEDPMPPVHYNLKNLDAALSNTKRARGLRGAIQHLGLEFPGTLHRASDDAAAVAMVFREIAPSLKRSKL